MDAQRSGYQDFYPMAAGVGSLNYPSAPRRTDLAPRPMGAAMKPLGLAHCLPISGDGEGTCKL